MKRKVPYAIMIGVIMTLLALSSTLASAAAFGSYENQAITAFRPELRGTNGNVTLLCNWELNTYALLQSNLTVNILVDGNVLGNNVSASGYTMDKAPWKLTNANEYFTSGVSHTVKVEMVNPGEKSGSPTSDNNKEYVLAPTAEWYSSIINGIGWLTYTVESVTDQVPFDIPFIGPYLAYIVVFIVFVVIVWYLLKRRKKKKMVNQRPPTYRPPEGYQQEQVQMPYYGRRRY